MQGNTQNVGTWWWRLRTLSPPPCTSIPCISWHWVSTTYTLCISCINCVPCIPCISLHVPMHLHNLHFPVWVPTNIYLYSLFSLNRLKSLLGNLFILRTLSPHHVPLLPAFHNLRVPTTSIYLHSPCFTE